MKLAYDKTFGRLVLAPVVKHGYDRFLATGETSRLGYSAMRKLYGCKDPRIFERFVTRTQSASQLLDLAADPQGLAAGSVDEVVGLLERDGFAVLDGRVAEADCAELEAVARAASCRLVGGDPAGPARARFDGEHPLAVRYDIDEVDVVECGAAQRIISDESLLAVAQRYLGASPVQDLVAMWWSTRYGDTASSAAAQQFHFDLDRPRFLKVFVFLSDVDDDTGPHIYVRGSHRTKPAALRRDGRHTDGEVERAYPGAARSITGARGTVFLADTIGLHKGARLVRGCRLMFQTEYSTSLFGAPYARPPLQQVEPSLARIAELYPSVLERFQLAIGA